MVANDIIYLKLGFALRKIGEHNLILSCFFRFKKKSNRSSSCVFFCFIKHKLFSKSKDTPNAVGKKKINNMY